MSNANTGPESAGQETSDTEDVASDALDDAAESELEEAREAAQAAMESTDRSDRPDPSMVEPATKEDVLNLRDDGELVTDTEVVETTDGYRTMEFKRPSATLVQWFEQQGADIGAEEFAEVYSRMVADPDLTPKEWAEGDLTAFVDLIPIVMEHLQKVMESEFVAEASAQIEQRSGETEGN